jgi:hypothetical protein
MQRSQAPASPVKQDYVGNQFKDTSQDQMLELTKHKIDEVAAAIERLLGLPPKNPSRPTTHPIYVNIVNPGQTASLIAKLKSTALTKATAAVAPGSYPT